MKGYIYCIENTINNKKYIGLTRNYQARISKHKSVLTLCADDGYYVELKADVIAYGLDKFAFYVLEVFDDISDSDLRDQETKWIDTFKTNVIGYNVMRSVKGKDNPAYNRVLSEQSLKAISEKQKINHANGAKYNQEWRNKIAQASSRLWQDEDKKRAMAQKVKVSRREYTFEQYTKDGELVKAYASMEDILIKNPTFTKSSIYNVCNGYKNTYKGFKWVKLPC
jgi:group I intron endonuclease